MMSAAIRLAVVDDHPLFREGVTRSLSEHGGFEIVGEGSSGEDAIRIAETQKPDIVLLDISMPGGGLNALASMLQREASQKVVMLTVSETNEDITAALSRGAKGYVLKGVGSKTLAEILQLVASGESYLSPVLTARLLSGAASADPLGDLNGREREILELVASGLSNKHVALRLDLQENTIKYYMTRILTKLNVSNRTEAAMVLRDVVDGRRPETHVG